MEPLWRRALPLGGDREQQGPLLSPPGPDQTLHSHTVTASTRPGAAPHPRGLKALPPSGRREGFRLLGRESGNRGWGEPPDPARPARKLRASAFPKTSSRGAGPRCWLQGTTGGRLDGWLDSVVAVRGGGSGKELLEDKAWNGDRSRPGQPAGRPEGSARGS